MGKVSLKNDCHIKFMDTMNNGNITGKEAIVFLATELCPYDLQAVKSKYPSLTHTL